MDANEDLLRPKLELIKESIIGFKFITDSLLDRADKAENDMANCKTEITELKNNTIRTDERMAAIQRYLDNMSSDVRSVRNAVIGAIIAALVLGTAGLALQAFKTQPSQPSSRHTPTSDAIAGVLA